MSCHYQRATTTDMAKSRKTTKTAKAKLAASAKAFRETERDPATLSDVEAVMRQVMKHPARPAAKSENREPTNEELNRKWKLTRRN